jgi:hypothetical protein
MQARAHTSEDRLVTEFIAHVNGAGDGPEARDAYREGFTRLRSQLSHRVRRPIAARRGVC